MRLCATALAVAALSPGVATAAWWPFSSAAPETPPANVIQDPHYGDTLFHFFKGRYFTAVTGLMVSQHFERVASHADEAEVLRGGLMLSYGLHRDAGEIFAKLIQKGTSAAVRDRAWYYLAKIRYQRGFLPEAEQAVDQVGKNLPPDLEEERGLLKANLLMARGDYGSAVSALEGLAKGTGTAGAYSRFNLGVAMIRNGDLEGGSKLLDELGRTPAANEEYRSLRDKANVALGFAALQAERPEDARRALERVRLKGLQSNKALLGFGWAAAALKDPKLALVPWTELAERDASDAAVLEARIAVPYALAELGAYGQSLERYNEAIGAFDKEGGSLNESIAAIRAGKLLTGLLESNPGEEMGWFWKIDELPEMPHANHLTQVLAQHEFQEGFKNYRDLRFLTRNLEFWKDSLGVFDDMLANRRQAFAERLPKILSKAGDSGLTAVQQRGEAVVKELARVAAESDSKALADAKQRDFLARIESSRATIATPGAEVEASTQERLRRVSGALTWQLAQQYPARLWDATKAVGVIQTQLTEAAQHDAALAQAQRDEPARFERFAARIKELEARIQALIPRVAALSVDQEKAVQGLAVAELDRQKERLAVYATQARFAVAQIYDRATSTKEGDRANKP
ncbi:MAG: tetratricopeptide repeat protein [Burkholderiales bacterium]|nr:tetratricopeptide repeat protein [Burkholderiales bacterium]